MSNSELSLGVIGTSLKPDEKRLPLDPDHLPRIAPELRRRIWLQQGYGERFGVPDRELEPLVAGSLTTDELLERCDVVLMAKPTAKDLNRFRDRQVLWGWPHCVQNEDITQVAIDKKLSFIAWEAMNLWPAPGIRGLHVFHKTNEIAGYAAVMHALQLAGRTGCYGAPLRAAVIHFGLTGRGAIHALRGLGITDITCFALSPPEDLAGQIPGVAYRQLGRRGETTDAVFTDAQGQQQLLSDELGSYDVIVNCIFQDTDRQLFFLRESDSARLRRGTLIVDVSCDRGLGFVFAKPTSFREPTFQVGDGITYYAVDHTPSYLWRSATYEISRALIRYLPTVMGGSEAWDGCDVVHNAIEIRDGVLINPKILTAQRRHDAYPHAKLAEQG